METLLERIPASIKSAKEYIAKHALRKPDEGERAAVIEMIKQLKNQGPLILVQNNPLLQQELLAFVNKVRSEHQLPEIHVGAGVEMAYALAKHGMKEQVESKLAEMIAKDSTLQDPQKQAKVREAMEAVISVMLFAHVCVVPVIAQIEKSIQTEDDAILFLFHLNTIFSPFMGWVSLLDSPHKKLTAERSEEAEKEAKETLAKMKKALAEKPPQTISKANRQLMIAQILSLTNESDDAPSLMHLIRGSQMKKDLLRFMNAIRGRLSSGLPELV